MTNFTVKVRADRGDTGTNKIELFLDTNPKREIMVLTERGDSLDILDEEDFRPEDEALYYAVERIAQLEKHADELAKFVEHSCNYACDNGLYRGKAERALKAYQAIKGSSDE